MTPDWTKEPVFLKQELAALVPEGAGRRGIVDLLAQVHLQTGACARVLCHVEAQAQRTGDLASRLFRDHTRLVESKRMPIFTLALLLDRWKAWRPDMYDDRLFGTGCRFEFRTVKLLDWKEKEDELLASPNPFAQVVLAWLELLRSRTGQQRLESKTRLFRGLLGRGLRRDVARDLLRFIGWVVKLPQPLEERFAETIRQEVRQMAGLKDGVYLLPWERDGFERGIRQGREEGRLENGRAAVLRILAARFGALPDSIRTGVDGVSDPAHLDGLIDAAVVTKSLGAFQESLARRT